MIQIKILDCQNQLRNYAFILINTQNNECALIDTVDTHIIQNYLKDNKLQLKYILNTHHHNDHIGGNLKLKNIYPECQIYGNQHDQKRIDGITHPVTEGDIIPLFDQKLNFKVLAFNGHTMGHIGFYEAEKKWLFSGDTLFNLGCGRRFEGSAEVFWETLSKISALPAQTLIYAAHEYTLDNINFAQSIIDETYPLYQEFLAYCQSQQILRDQNQPTIPFTLEAQLKFNPFLLCAHPVIANNVLNRSNDYLIRPNKTVSHDIFAKMRLLKDNF